MNERTLTIQITNAPATVGIEDTARLRCIVGTMASGRIIFEADFMQRLHADLAVENALKAFVVRWANEVYFEVMQDEKGE